jgi:tetratricopeptide (TPR) repeat protein
MFGRAVGAHEVGRLDVAERGYRAVLAVAPTHPECLHLLGLLVFQTGRSEMAVELLQRAVELQPEEPVFLNNLGNILRDTGCAADACDYYGRALRLDPSLADIHHNLGKALHSLEQVSDAEAAFRRALQLAPQHFDAQNDLGNLLCDAGRETEAVVCFNAALRLRPHDARVWNNIGRAMVGLGQLAAAVENFRAALRVQPDYLKAQVNLGNALNTLQQWDPAIAAWREAVRLAPDDAEAHTALGIALLLTGRLLEGWPEFEWFRQIRRNDTSRPRIDFPPATWNGEAIGAGTLVLYSDQGLGDAIQFSRYVPLCSRLARIVLAAPATLGRLLAPLPGVAAFYGEPPLPEPYVHCALSSLPRIFGTQLDNIPASVPYLRADAADVAAWRQRVAPLDGLLVGIVWAGDPTYISDERRSLPLDRLAAAVAIPGVSLISLQKGAAARQIAALDGSIALHDWMDECGDMAGTAALIEALDLVIGVDTSVVHLAGALGRPVWLLNRFDTDWRWLLDRDDSPWYPTLRQFRQDRLGEWEAALARLRAALAEFAADGPGRRGSR